VENLRSEIQALRRITDEVLKDPFRSFTEFANRLEDLEKVITSVRKGSTPSVEASVKERALGMLEEIAKKITEATLAKSGSAVPQAAGVKLSALPCPNCKQPVPLPAVEGVEVVTCPNCGGKYRLQSKV